MNNIYLNTILYGVAGTGKTYSSIIYAVAIVEDKSVAEISKLEYSKVIKKFQEYRSKNLIETITFHQSYSYEDFIEGIKPNLKDNNISYRLHEGVFKRFCNYLLEWNFLIGQDVSSKSAKHYKYIVDSVSNENINIKKFKLGTGQDGKIVCIPIQMILNLIQSIKNNEITIIDLKNTDAFDSISLQYDSTIVKSYSDIITNIVEKVLTNNSFNSNQNRVFIIDEINRGNIANIFGELISLIEPSKRLGNLEELRIKLPYSQELFGVPKNIYILGTMNLSDHSTVSFDTALRRRFHYVETFPNYDMFKGLYIEDIEVSNMFKRINLRIEHLIGKDFLIGHTYFLDLLNSPNMDTLSQIFRYTIIPLLEDYFYNDYNKIRLVLADNQTDIKEHQFILESYSPNDLFGNLTTELNPTYEINIKAFENAESYRKI